EPQEVLPARIRDAFVGHWRIDDCLSTDQIEGACRALAHHLGNPDRLMAATEQIQVQVAEVRERLGVEGMRAETARLFRDKSLMKEKFRKAGVACARHRAATNEAEAWEFLEKNG